MGSPRIDQTGLVPTYDRGADVAGAPTDATQLPQPGPQAPAGDETEGKFKPSDGGASSGPTPLDDPVSKAVTQFQLGSPSQNASPVDAAKNLRVAGAGDDLNLDVRNDAAHLVGKPVVGDGECYDLADQVLRNSGAKSAPDFGKVTKSRDQDYKWGTPTDLKDVKPGDILQFRNHEIQIQTVKKTTRTFPGGGSSVTKEENTVPLERGQHTAVVLSNDGDGTMRVVEQHVLDHRTGKLSTTVRENTLYTREFPPTTTTRTLQEGNVIIKEETTVIIIVTGIIYAYRPQPRDQ